MVVSELFGSVLRLYLPKTNVNLCIFAPILDSVKVYCLHVQNSRPLCVLQDLLLKRKMHLTQFVCLTQPQPHSPPTRTRPEEDPPKPEPPGSSGGGCTRDLLSPVVSSGLVQVELIRSGRSRCSPSPSESCRAQSRARSTQGRTRGEAGGIKPTPGLGTAFSEP